MLLQPDKHVHMTKTGHRRESHSLKLPESGQGSPRIWQCPCLHSCFHLSLGAACEDLGGFQVLGGWKVLASWLPISSRAARLQVEDPPCELLQNRRGLRHKHGDGPLVPETDVFTQMC